MWVGIVIGVIIAATAIYLDLRNKAKKSERQLENLSISVASFVRRGQLMEQVMTEQQKEKYTEVLERDTVAKMIMETDVAKRSEYLKELAGSDEEQYYEITFRVSAMKGNGE